VVLTLEEKGRLRKTAVTASLAVMAVCVAISAVVLGVLIKRTGWFAVRTVAIEGIDRADEADLRLITDAWLSRSLLRVRTKLLVYRLKEVPWIRDAKVRLSFPSTLKVSVTPRMAVALLNTRTDYGYKMYLLDAEGVILAQFGGGRPADRPVLTGLEMRNLYTGERVDFPELNRLLKVLGWMRLESPGLYDELEEINFENAYGVIRYRVLLTRRNIPVRTLRLDRDFFRALGTVLAHRGGAEGIVSMTCLSNMIFVETRGSGTAGSGDAGSGITGSGGRPAGERREVRAR
jgi:cell division protein FtsQ